MKGFRTLIWTFLIFAIPGFAADGEIREFAPPAFNSISLSTDNSVLTLVFSEGVFSNSGNLAAADFNITVSGGQATLSSYNVTVHTGGQNTVVFNLSLNGLADGNETLEVRPSTNSSIRNGTFEFMSTADNISTALFDRQPPRILINPMPQVITIDNNNFFVDIAFDDPVFGGAGSSAFEDSDLTAIFTASTMTSMSISGIRRPDGATLVTATNLQGGETVIRVFLVGTNGPPDGSETIELAVQAGAIYDDAGNVTDGSETTGPLPVTANCDPTFLLSANPNTACSVIFANGEIIVNISSGTGNYSISVAGPITPAAQTGAGSQFTFSGLLEGSYTVTVLDNGNLCQSSALITVPSAQALPVITVSTVPNSNCSTPNGEVSASLGGLPLSNYRFELFSGNTADPQNSLGQQLGNSTYTGLPDGNYYLEVREVATGCTSGQSLTVDQNFDFPAVTSFTAADDTVCEGVGTNLIVSISGGTGPYTVEIDQGVGILSNYTSGDPIAISPTQNTTYTIVSLTDNLGCSSNSQSAPASVIFSSNPQIFDLTGGGVICSNVETPVNLTLSGSESGTNYNLLRDGSLVNTLIGNGSSLNFEVSQVGNYTVDAINQAGCGSSMTGTSVVQSEDEAALTGPISGSETVCIGQSGYTYSIPDQSDFEVNWTVPPGFTILDGNNTNTISVRIEDNATSGQISASGITQCGETKPLVLAVTVENSPKLFIETETLINAGTETTFIVNSSSTLSGVEWTLGDGNTASGATVAHTYTQGGNYRLGVLATSENGCQAETSRAILVIQPPKVIIKNVVTANGDGDNDLLWIENITDFPRNEVIFLDRWGVEVAAFTNYQNDWDLTNGGEYIPAGNYLCIVRLEEGDVYSMTVTVIRQ